MELLSQILLAIWLVGVVANVASVVHFTKKGDGELHDRFVDALDMAPIPVLGLLTVLIVAWPATLLVSIATKRK